MTGELKTCGCCERLWVVGDSWELLPLVGYCGAASGDAKQVLELRNCPCGSTLAMDVPRESMEPVRRTVFAAVSP